MELMRGFREPFRRSLPFSGRHIKLLCVWFWWEPLILILFAGLFLYWVSLIGSILCLLRNSRMGFLLLASLRFRCCGCLLLTFLYVSSRRIRSWGLLTKGLLLLKSNDRWKVQPVLGSRPLCLFLFP